MHTSATIVSSPSAIGIGPHRYRTRIDVVPLLASATIDIRAWRVRGAARVPLWQSVGPTALIVVWRILTPPAFPLAPGLQPGLDNLPGRWP